METSPTTEKTLFRREAEQYQDNQKRTKSEGLKTGLELIGISILLFVISFIVAKVFKISLPSIYLLAIVVGFLSGLYGIISSVIRPGKQVTCPRCDTVHGLFKKERLYMCTDCGTLLNMGKDVESPIEFVTCPYCEHQTAVSHDHEDFLCFNCGVTRSPTMPAVDWETTKCSSCEEIVPREALYCKRCGQILKPLPAYDLDWVIGKDARGHFHFARMLMATFAEKEAALASRLSDDSPSGRRKWSEALGEVRVLLERLARVQRSLEVALQEQDMRAPVERLLPEIDFLYARLLVLEFKTFVWAEGPEKAKLRVKSEGSYFDTFNEGPQIQARKRLEKILGLESLQSAGSIGPWDDGGLVGSFSEKDAFGKYTILNLAGYATLQAEARRFAEWAKQSGHSVDLLATIQMLEEKISVRKKEDLPVQAATTVAEKREPAKKGEAAAGAATPVSSAPIAPSMPRSTGESAKPKRKWGCLLLSCGLLILAVGLILVAAVAVSLFDSAGAANDLVGTLAKLAICSLPIFLIGSVLLVVGIKVFRGKKKQPTAAPTDSRTEGMALEDSKELFREGLGLFNQGKSREAIPILEKVTRIDPTFAPAQFTLGGAYSKVAGEYGDDEDAVRSWANKSAEAFRKAISLASLYGGLNDKQLALAQNAVMTYERAEKSYKTQREASSLPEDQQKRIYAEFMETKNSELLQGIDIQDIKEASRRGELAQMADRLERDATEAEKVAMAKITAKYRITKEQLMAIAQEGEEKKWPWGDM